MAETVSESLDRFVIKTSKQVPPPITICPIGAPTQIQIVTQPAFRTVVNFSTWGWGGSSS